MIHDQENSFVTVIFILNHSLEVKIFSALVNGNNCLGATVGKYSMNLAIQKCKAVGVGVVTAKGNRLEFNSHSISDVLYQF